MQSARLLASIACAASLPLCECRLGDRLAKKQFPSYQTPYGQVPYPPSYGLPTAPYGAPYYSPPGYGQPNVQPYAPPKGYPYPWPYSVPAQPKAPSLPPTSIVQPTDRPVSKESGHEVREYLQDLSGVARRGKDPEKYDQPMMKSMPALNFAKNLIKGGVGIARKTYDIVHEAKTKNNTGEKLKQLLHAVPRETAQMLEHIAVPIVGTAAVNSMPLTKREKLLAEFGLVTATGRLMQFDHDTPLIWEVKHDNVSDASEVSSNTTATVDADDADTEPPKRTRQTTAFERQVLNWAARGD